ncbi:MAG TPA: alpha/beta fold hydrolase [Solirubrobacteraceae bacterium]|nr:alpha/beta fold hydrolase [Solirubrobacteraceae bacterium]
MAETVVLLHGFAGTHRLWDGVIGRLGAQRYIARAPDLRGHGSAVARRPITFAACADDVLAAAPGRFILCGYSLGGRVALHAALAAPERITRLVLVATTAGIDDPAERAARRAADLDLADRTAAGTIEDFVARWSAQPLFAGDPPAIVPAWQRDMRRNDPQALAEVLRGIGTGAMEPLWDRLGELRMPAAVLAGVRDAKFVGLGERLAAGLAAGRLTVVPGAGHGVPREAPGAVAAAITAAG